MTKKNKQPFPNQRYKIEVLWAVGINRWYPFYDSKQNRL